MTIQSLSVVVPSKSCINNCHFCVSRMCDETYPNLLDEKLPFYDLYEADYIKRLEFARDNGCNIVMLTGNCEPQQNRSFLQRFGTINRNLSCPFRWVEMQTTGIMIEDPYLRFLRNHVGVSTISVSVAAFDNHMNNQIIRPPKNYFVNLVSLCTEIKKYDFNLRLSINLTDAFNVYASQPDEFFKTCRTQYYADQVTLRIMYGADGNSPQSIWLREHKINENVLKSLKSYVIEKGTPLEKLEYGRTKYSVYGMSVVIDDDCMAKELSNTYKYAILRPNCKLYSRWDDKGSLIF